MPPRSLTCASGKTNTWHWKENSRGFPRIQSLWAEAAVSHYLPLTWSLQKIEQDCYIRPVVLYPARLLTDLDIEELQRSRMDFLILSAQSNRFVKMLGATCFGEQLFVKIKVMSASVRPTGM